MDIRRRIRWLDVARVIAIISISSNHAINRAFRVDGNVYEAFLQHSCYVSLLHSVIFIFSRIGVPIFLMITGVLILNKSFDNCQDVKRFYKHNLLSMFITSEIWLFLMFWYRTIFHANDILKSGGILYAIRRCIETMLFINQETMGNMWYIPMILCFYLLLPFVSVAIKKLDSRWLWIPIIIVCIEALLFPNINRVFELLGLNNNLELALGSSNLFSRYFVFILIGYFINQGIMKKIPNVVINIVSVLMFVICVAYQYWEYTLPIGEKVGYNFFPLTVCSVFIFEAIRRFCKDKEESDLITYVSRVSFGIFFLHIFITSAMARFTIFNHFNPIVSFVVFETVSVVGSVMIIRVLSRIPFCKRYLFLVK